MDADDRSAGGGLLSFAGAMLVLAGLISGLAVEAMENPRMGLSAHLEGLLNGMLLLALASAWHRLALAPLWRRLALVLVLYGSFANFISTQLAAYWGTGRLTPLAGSGHAGTTLQEGIVAFGLVSLSAAMVAGFAILLAGFWRGR